MKERKLRRWEINPNGYTSPKGWVLLKWRKLINFLHHATHPNLTKPWTFKKYFKVMGVYNRCMVGFAYNHKAMRGKADAASYGYQAWQDSLKEKAVTRIDERNLSETPHN